MMFQNMPVTRCSYLHYQTKKEKLVLLLGLPGCRENYDWKFNELRDSITVLDIWGRAMHDVSTLFKSELKQKTITLDHPKIHALQYELLRKGIERKSVPQCSIVIPLGKRVQKDDGVK